jgi:arsenite methyltransferase
MVLRAFALQLARPTGLLGRFVRSDMNRRNAAMNAYAVEQLDLQPTDRVLEIGFGGGVNLPGLISATASVVGVDPSPDVVRAAIAQYGTSERVEFRQGAVEELPCASGEFDKVCTVNTIYFWRALDAGFAQIHRVLAEGGRVVVAFLPKAGMTPMNMPSDIFTLRDPDDVVAAMLQAGFRNVHVERPQASTPWNAIMGTR